MVNRSSIRRPHRSGHWVGGLVLIGLGTMLLLDNLAYINIGEWTSYWPFIIACIGAARIIEARSPAEVSKGGFMIFAAFWIYACLEHIWGLNFQNSWPIILIAVGVRHIVAGLATRSDNTSDTTQS